MSLSNQITIVPNAVMIAPPSDASPAEQVAFWATTSHMYLNQLERMSRIFSFISECNDVGIRVKDIEAFAIDNNLSFRTPEDAVSAVVEMFASEGDSIAYTIRAIKQYTYGVNEAAQQKRLKDDEELRGLVRKFNEVVYKLAKDAGMSKDTRTAVANQLKRARKNPMWARAIVTDKALLGESYVDITLNYFEVPRTTASQYATQLRSSLRALGVIQPSRVDASSEVLREKAFTEMFGDLIEYYKRIEANLKQNSGLVNALSDRIS